MAHDPIAAVGKSLNDLLKSKSRGRRLAVQRSAGLTIPLRPERNDFLPALELVYRDPHHLKMPTRNVRKRDSAHVREVSNSIAAFGFIDPPFIDEADNVLDGVVRVEGAKHHGLDRIPCIVAGHLTPAQRKLARLAVNRLQEKGAWDLAELTLEMKELVFEEASLELTGFSVSEIDQITLDSDPPVAEDGPLEPDTAAPAIAKLGDIRTLGPHRIICGDARDPTVISSLMADQQTRLILTDEPYNVTIKNNVTGGAHREFAMASGEMSDADFAKFNTDWMKAALDYLVDGGLSATFIDWRGLQTVQTAAAELGLSPINLIVWAKTNAGVPISTRIASVI